MVLLIWALALGLALALLLGAVESIGPWEIGDHAFDALLNEFPLWLVFVLGAFVAPIIEELIFRGPLWFFRESKYFRLAFYTSAVAFALVHVSNFPNFSQVWFLAPLLISPQFFLGLFLGYIRVRFGLLWAMIFHSAYNGILLGPILLLMHLGISVS
jgi:membrane protease YdiL (CAAX protease family)